LEKGRGGKYFQNFQQFLFPFASELLSKKLEHTTFLMLAREKSIKKTQFSSSLKTMEATAVRPTDSFAVIFFHV